MLSLTFVCPHCGKQFRNLKPELAGKKAKCACGKTVQLGAKRTSEVDSARAADDIFGDLDQILAGEGDAAPIPIASREPSSTTTVTASGSLPKFAARRESTAASPMPNANARRRHTRRTNISTLAACTAATIGFWTGVLLLWSRFQIVDSFLLRPVMLQLNSMCRATFVATELTETQRYIFLGLGWLVVVIGAALVFACSLQFVNAVLQLLTKRRLFKWTDGVVAALAVVLLFALVSGIFTHATVTQQQLKSIQQFNRLTDADAELENAKAARLDFEAQGKDFQVTLSVIAGIALSLFLVTSLRMLTQTTDIAAKTPELK